MPNRLKTKRQTRDEARLDVLDALGLRRCEDDAVDAA